MNPPILLAYLLAAVANGHKSTACHTLCKKKIVTREFMKSLTPEASCVKDGKGRIPLHYLCSNEVFSLDIVSEVLHTLKFSLESNDVGKEGDINLNTPLHLACKNKLVKAELLKCLVEFCPEAAKVKNRQGDTPLHLLCLNENVRIEMVKAIANVIPEALGITDKTDKTPLGEGSHPLEYLPENMQSFTWSVYESSVDGRSLGRSHERHESMMTAFRQSNSKAIETVVEDFAANEREGTLDLYAWQHFLEIRHQDNPDKGYFAVELHLLFHATWQALALSNARTDEYNKNIAVHLKKVIEKWVMDCR